MTDEYLWCNYENCSAPLLKKAWITRCSHVFCDEHGSNSFSTKAAKIKCPACGDLKNKETDVIQADLEPNDLIICCVRPEKAFDFAEHAAKLWCYQMKVRRKMHLESVTRKYDKMAVDATLQLRYENKEMERFLHQVEAKLKSVNEELIVTKQKLHKYKSAYDLLCLQKRPGFYMGNPTFTATSSPSGGIKDINNVFF